MRVARLVRQDSDVGGGVRDAGQDEALLRLLVIEEGLVRLVDGALLRVVAAGAHSQRMSATRRRAAATADRDTSAE